MSERPEVKNLASADADAKRARLARMFTAHSTLVWRILRRHGLSPDAAADATQQAFLIVAQRLEDVNPDSERAFLIGTALRAAHSLSRTTSRWQLDPDIERRPAEEPDDRADVQLCDRALSKVNPELAKVFVLYEIEGLSSPEIAALLEIPLGSVASRLRRAREQFRAAFLRLERAGRIGGDS